jgi:ABC-type Zn uptake system ZnuABC Zn-binding protein ZnuA
VVPPFERSLTRVAAIRGRLRRLALAIVLAAAPVAHADAPALPVVATIEPLGMLLRELGGERVAVTVLVPPGASPHTFEPQPSDVARLAEMRLLVEVGGDFDAWVARLRHAATSGAPVFTVLALPGLDAFADAHRAPRSGSTAPGHAADPHVWLDPVRVREVIAPALSNRLAELDAAAAPRYAARLQAFRDRLDALDREIRAQLAGPKRSYVAFHPAWRYFGARYELDEVGVVEQSAGEGPTPRELATLLAAAKRAQVPAILIEPQLDPRVAQTLAREFDATVVLVDPNGDPADPARARYEDLMRWNARAFARALGGAAR